MEILFDLDIRLCRKCVMYPYTIILIPTACRFSAFKRNFGACNKKKIFGANCGLW